MLTRLEMVVCLVNDLVRASGCGCCRDERKFEIASDDLKKVLGIEGMSFSDAAAELRAIEANKIATTYSDHAMECPQCKEVSLRPRGCSNCDMYECDVCHLEVQF